MIVISPNYFHVLTCKHCVMAMAIDLFASSPDMADVIENDRIFAEKCFRWSLIIQHWCHHVAVEMALLKVVVVREQFIFDWTLFLLLLLFTQYKILLCWVTFILSFIHFNLLFFFLLPQQTTSCFFFLFPSPNWNRKKPWWGIASRLFIKILISFFYFNDWHEVVGLPGGNYVNVCMESVWFLNEKHRRKM